MDSKTSKLLVRQWGSEVLAFSSQYNDVGSIFKF